MRKNMKFEEFTKCIKERILEYLPECYADAEVKLQVVNKINDVELNGLSILMPERNIAPTIYLENFFNMYQEGTEIEEILEMIADIQIKNEVKSNFDTSFVTDFEKCKDKILPRLIGVSFNKKELENCPHVIIEDLAVVFYIDLGVDEQGAMSIKIHNGILETWKVETSKLYEVAMDNLKKQNNSVFQSMNEVMFDIMLPDVIKEYGGNEEEARMFLEAMMPQEHLMYVVSNKNKVYGACAILNEEIIEEIIEKIGDTFYILPSSVHECLVLAANEEYDRERLEDMVWEVNHTQVEPEERLSNNVYIYNKERGLKIA